MKKVQEYILALRARWTISKALFMRESFELTGDIKKGIPSKLQVLCNVIFCLLLEFGQAISRWRIRRRFAPAVLSPSQNATLNNFAGKVLVHGGNNADRGTVLGDRCDSKKFYVHDFVDFNKLVTFIGEAESREADFTKKGLEFLEEFYGLENLARMLYERDPFFPGKSPEENVKFFRDMAPP